MKTCGSPPENGHGFVIAVFLFILLSLSPAYAGKYALVIGNGSYRHPSIPKLDTPVNDANAMTETLENLGFYVTKGTDMTLEEMETAILNFRNRLHTGDTALFYYSGHGVQMDGRNLMLPVEIAKNKIRYAYLVTVNDVLDKIG